MAEPTTTLEQRLGVQTLPIPVTDTPATNDIIRLVYEQILGITPTPEQMARYDGLTVRDLYDDIAQQKEALAAGSGPNPDLLELSQRWGSQTPEQAAVDNGVILAFKVYVGRTPTAEELKSFSAMDPTMSLEMMKDLGDREKEAAKEAPFLKAGEQWLIQFTEDPTPGDDSTGTDTYWLFNNNDHNLNGVNYTGSLIPFASEEAVNKFFEGKTTLAELKAAGKVVPTSLASLKDPESDFYNARIVKYNDGVNSKGNMGLEESLRWRHGQSINKEAEQTAAMMLRNVFSAIRDNDDNFSESYFANAFDDKLYFSKYINALAYGGYTIPDIYMDIVAHNKRVEGDPMFADYKGISSQISRDAWKNTSPDYKLLTNPNTPIYLPDNIPNLNMDDLSYSFWDMPASLMKFYTSPDLIDYKNPEVMAKIQEYQAFAEETAIAMAEANNEQERIAAEHNWNVLREEIKKDLGYELSDNAFTAWNQLEQLKGTMSERGILNSGIMNKAMDLMNREMARANERFRESAKTREEEALRTRLLNDDVSPEEFDEFIAKYGEEKAKEWGIIPSDEVQAYYTYDNLKELFPDASDLEIQRVIDMVVTTTPGGNIVNTPVSKKQNLNERFRLEDSLLEAQTDAFYRDEQAKMEEATKDALEGSVYGGDGGYKTGGPSAENTPETAGGNTWYEDRSKLYPNFSPSLIRDPKDLVNYSKDQIARTSGNNIYKRDLNAERALIGYYRDKVAGGKAPETEEEWKKFRDFVYEPATSRPATNESIPSWVQPGFTEKVGEGRYKNPETGEIMDDLVYRGGLGSAAEAAKNFGASSATGAPSSSGFQGTAAPEWRDTAWETFKSSNPNRDWSQYEKLTASSDKSLYEDIQGGQGFKALYGRRKR